MTREQAGAAWHLQGISGWLQPGAYGAAEQFLDESRALRAQYLRLAITVGQWDRREGRVWIRWLAKAASSFEFTLALYRHVPTAAPALPPVRIGEAAAYRRIIEELGEELATRCAWLELADPLGPPVWPDASSACGALFDALRLPSGLRWCLGGLPLDSAWVNTARANGVLRSAAALAFSHWSPDQDVEPLVAAVGDAAGAQQARALWLTPIRLPAKAVEAGRLGACIGACVELLESAADRFYFPLRPALTPQHHAPGDPAAGAEALAARLLRDGGGAALRGLHERLEVGRRARVTDHDLVIGGAGFVGCNMAARLAASGRNVLVLDNLSRAGTEHNLSWLSRRFPHQIRALIADIRDEEAVDYAVERAQRVFHFAAQVAVTTSLTYPRHDHQVNATGTLNVLEALRRRREPPPLLFTSTNKVYGELADIALQLTASGYQPLDPAIRATGIDERRPLALCSPYGCSKGAADQYVLDYARSYGLPAVVFRMSCIYGPRQFGNEDQGWVAHFVRQTLAGGEITLYGDGHQIRDVLFVDDLVEAALRVLERLPTTAGEVFNIGGGAGQVLSLNGLLQLLGRLHGTTPAIHLEDWRPSDQRYYVSDSAKLYRTTGWRPEVSVEQGVYRLYEWMRAQVRSAGPPPDPAQGRVAI